MSLDAFFMENGEKDFDGTYFIETGKGDYIIYDPCHNDYYYDDGSITSICESEAEGLLIGDGHTC